MAKDDVIGGFRQIVLARATDDQIRKGRKGSGGAVTALLLAGQERGMFDAVVATVKRKGIEGAAVVIKDKETLLRTAGSRWTLVENLRLLYQALSSYQANKAAVVCTPCQAHFLRQTAIFPLVEGSDISERLALTIGLFCMGTFSQPSFTAFLRRRFGISPSEVTDIDLRDGFLYIEAAGLSTPLKISVSEATEFVNLGCLLCDDYTARDADISAGVAAAANGWTVLLIRTDVGEEALKFGVANGFVETAPASSEVLDEVRCRAEEKIRRSTSYKLTIF